MRNYLSRAVAIWGDRNIKKIRYAEIEDFLFSLDGLSGKTRHNARNALHHFLTWLKKRRVIDSIPDMPSVEYELGWRRTIDKELQGRVLEELERIAPWQAAIGIKWLSIYIMLRPGDLRRILESDIDRKNGFLFIMFKC